MLDAEATGATESPWRNEDAVGRLKAQEGTLEEWGTGSSEGPKDNEDNEGRRRESWGEGGTW